VYIAVDDVFLNPNTILITITSGPQGTSVYLDGVKEKTFSEFSFTAADLTGRLVIGNSPVDNRSWSGYVWGLGIFDHELPPAQVSQHYAAWLESQGSALSGTDSAKALYFFDERTGRVAHNQRASEPNLDIPERYFVLHPQFLKVPWEEFEDNWGYWTNFVLNVVAFVPFGLAFCAYFSSVMQLKRGLATTICMGALLSLSIEMLQAFIPTRDSGMTDVITNTSGAAIGAWLYAWLTRKNLREKAR
jgi:VanZ family protein